jgi:predicted GNAT family N-acyltransferase
MPHSSDFRIQPVSSDADWDAARAIREQVFIVEQDCPPEEEWDAHDATSRHLLGWLGTTPVATARWRTVPYGEVLAAKLERFAVLPAYRGHGYGRALVKYALADARRAGFTAFVLHAQAHLEDFYAAFGFETVSGVFEEAGIPHVKMVRVEDASA